MVTARHKRGAAALGGALTFALALAGCGGGDGDDKPSAAPSTAVPTPTPATSSADPQAADKAAVLAAYDAMSVEQAKAYRQASANGTELEKHATLDALGQIRNDLARMKEAGTVVRGEIGHDAKVTALDIDAKTPKATVSDCVDLSKYETYDTKAKKVIPLPTEQPLRYVMTATVERWDGQWLVTRINTQGGPTC
jgi:flagellar motor protein MotB